MPRMSVRPWAQIKTVDKNQMNYFPDHFVFDYSNLLGQSNLSWPTLPNEKYFCSTSGGLQVWRTSSTPFALRQTSDLIVSINENWIKKHYFLLWGSALTFRSIFSASLTLKSRANKNRMQHLVVTFNLKTATYNSSKFTLTNLWAILKDIHLFCRSNDNPESSPWTGNKKRMIYYQRYCISSFIEQTSKNRFFRGL